MAEVEKAKTSRTTCKAKLTSKLRNFRSLTETDDANTWDIAWKDVQETANDLYSAHDLYVQLRAESDEDYDIESEDAYIQQEVDRLKAAKELWLSNSKTRLRRVCNQREVAYNSVANGLTAALASNDISRSGLVESVLNMLQDLQLCKDALDTAFASLMERLEGDELMTEFSKTQILSDSYYVAKSTANEIIAKCRHPMPEQPIPEFVPRTPLPRVEPVFQPRLTLPLYGSTPVSDEAVNGTFTAPRSNLGQVRMERIRPPVFDGAHRNYLEWKRRFQALVIPGRNPTEVCQLIWDVIPQKHRHLLNNLALDDITGMFDVLDKQFGNPAFTVSTIVDDIESLSTPRDSKMIIRFVETVERAVVDLEGQNSVAEIKNTTVCRRLERKLPDKYYEEWVKSVAELDTLAGADRFEILFSFLLRIKRREEYKAKDPARTTAPTYKTASTKLTEAEGVGSGYPQQQSWSKCCKICNQEPDHAPWRCKMFQNMNVGRRWLIVRTKRLCILCLGSGHLATNCPATGRAKVCKECEKPHNIMLHGDGNGKRKENHPIFKRNEATSKSATTEKSDVTPLSASTQLCKSTLSATSGQELPCIMMMQFIKMYDGSEEGVVFDQCSDTSYITFALAKRLNLRGEKCTLSINGIAGLKMEIDTRRYKVKLRTVSGKLKEYVMYGLQEVARVTQQVDPEVLQELFPDCTKDDLRRPETISMMISLQNSTSIPGPVEHDGELTLYHGIHGFVVGGSHERLNEGISYIVESTNTHLAFTALTSVYHENSHSFHTTQTSSKDVQALVKHFCYDQIGAACTPACGGCSCGACQTGGKLMSLKDEHELAQIERGLYYRPHGDNHSPQPHWDCKYPYTVDPQLLPNNYGAVKAVFLSTERKLEKNPEWKQIYRDQVHEMVQRGAARKLSKVELESWNGPSWYVSHQVAPNPNSKTTPVRLVWNSSQVCKGVSLNAVLMKGPDVLNPLPTVLLRFREGVEATVGDIKKMFNSVYLVDEEIQMRRFLWRDNPSDDLETYCILRVNIGDKPAPSIAMTCVKKTSELPQFANYEKSIESIQRSMYVDDLLDSRDSKEEIAMLQKEVIEILESGGFKMKCWLTSGETASMKPASIKLLNAIGDEESRALGLGYDTEADQLYIRSMVNFSDKANKVKLGCNLSIEGVMEQTPNPLTKRMILSQIASTFDPVGFSCPVKMSAAILFRETWQLSRQTDGKPTDWDSGISDKLRDKWLLVLQSLVELNDIRFPRSLKPLASLTDPVLITFSDGSDKAFGAVVYVRWKAVGQEDKYIVRFVEAKGKLSPLVVKGDVVKSEICGAVFAVRMRKTIMNHTKIRYERFYHFVDSMTVLGAVKKDSYGYQTFFANRVGEIQSLSSPEQWAWVPSKENPADVITRGAGPDNITVGSFFNAGPAWLTDTEDDWPITRNITKEGQLAILSMQRKSMTNAVTRSQGMVGGDDIKSSNADCADMRKKTQMCATTLVESLDPSRYSTFERLQRTLASVLLIGRWWKVKALQRKTSAQQYTKTPCDFLKIGEDVKWRFVPSVKDLEEARNLIFLSQQDNISQSMIDSLVAYRDTCTGLLVTSGRFGRSDATLLDFCVPVIQSGHVARLITEVAHNKGHLGVDSTLAKARRIAWIIKGRKTAKTVVYQCVICRKLKPKSLTQIMGDLPAWRAIPSAPFQFTAVDLFGPVKVKGEVNKRTFGKAWGVVFTCLTSRAVHADLACDYGTEAFMLVFRRFQALRGSPSIMYSDRGTQLEGAAAELIAYVKSLDHVELERKGAAAGVQWKFHPPAAPHANGPAESAVKLVKKALKSTVMKEELTFQEWITVLYEAANLVNERPLVAHVTDDHNIDYICANKLLLGRATSRIDPGPTTCTKGAKHRYEHVQSIIKKFWGEWERVSYPNLVTRQKWHVLSRNLEVGDVVLVQNKGLSTKGEYRMSIIRDTFPDEKGNVRRVTIGYKNLMPGKKYEGVEFTDLQRDVRSLVLLMPVGDKSE